MMRGWCLFAVACGLRAGSLSLTYPDGTSLNIEIASTGSTVVGSYNGAVESEGAVWNRVVYDKTGKAIFAYALEAGRGSPPDKFYIRIKPVELAYAWKLQKGGVPTVSAIREFADVKSGQSVALDILYNRTTGDKIYDLLQPFAAPVGDELAFSGMSMTVNGQALKELAGVGMTGAGVLIYAPGHGAWVMAAQARPGFSAIGHVEGGRLWFESDGDRVEIQSKGPVLSNPEKNVVWVRHEPGWRSESSAREIARLQTKLAELRKTYKDDHPLVRQVQSQMEALQAQGAQPEIRSSDRVEWLLGK